MKRSSRQEHKVPFEAYPVLCTMPLHFQKLLSQPQVASYVLTEATHEISADSQARMFISDPKTLTIEAAGSTVAIPLDSATLHFSYDALPFLLNSSLARSAPSAQQCLTLTVGSAIHCVLFSDEAVGALWHKAVSDLLRRQQPQMVDQEVELVAVYGVTLVGVLSRYCLEFEVVFVSDTDSSEELVVVDFSKPDLRHYLQQALAIARKEVSKADFEALCAAVTSAYHSQSFLESVPSRFFTHAAPSYGPESVTTAVAEFQETQQLGNAEECKLHLRLEQTKFSLEKSMNELRAVLAAVQLQKLSVLYSCLAEQHHLQCVSKRRPRKSERRLTNFLIEDALGSPFLVRSRCKRMTQPQTRLQVPEPTAFDSRTLTPNRS